MTINTQINLRKILLTSTAHADAESNNKVEQIW